MNPTIGTSVAMSFALFAIFSVQASIPSRPGDLTNEDISEYSAMKPAMSELSDKLNRDAFTSQMMDNVKAVRKALETDFGPNVRGTKAQMRKLMLLLENFDYVSAKCTVEGADILSKTYLAMPENKFDHKRIYEIFDEARKDHAKYCLPTYKSGFAAEVQKVSKDDLEKIEKTIGKLVGEDFYCSNSKSNTEPTLDAFAMPTPDFKLECSKSALNKIASGIAKQVKGTPQWESLKAIDSTRFGISHVKQPKIPASIFDEYLFNPCKNYLEQVTDKLTSARFDVFFGDHFESSDAQEEYISGDKTFYQALIHNRFCRSLVRDQEKLYKPLRKAWKRSSESF